MAKTPHQKSVKGALDKRTEESNKEHRKGKKEREMEKEKRRNEPRMTTRIAASLLTESKDLDAMMARAVRSAMSLALRLRPSLQVGKLWKRARWKPGGEGSVWQTSLDDVVARAYKEFSVHFGTRDAQTWAEGFTFPESARTADKTIFDECGGDFNVFVLRKREAYAGERLSTERISRVVDSALLSDPKDLTILQDIAAGVQCDRLANYRPSCTREGFCKRYLETSNAVNKLLYTRLRRGHSFYCRLRWLRLFQAFTTRANTGRRSRATSRAG